MMNLKQNIKRLRKKTGLCHEFFYKCYSKNINLDMD